MTGASLQPVLAAPQPRLVLVLGMHRSGTSLLAGMLARLGLPLGGPLLEEAREDAPTGYAEHAQVVAIQEELLGSLGRGWAGPDGMQPLPSTWRGWPESRQAQAALTEIARRELAAGGGVWGLKDPRSCRFLPLWRDIARACGAELVPLLALRHPDAVARSLAARNDMEVGHASALWLRHLHDVAAALPDRRPVVFDYDDVLADPTAAAVRLADATGLRAEPEAIGRAASLADRRHRHHAPAAAGAEEATALYADLLAGAWPPPPEPVRAPRDEVTIVMRATRPTMLPRAVRSVLSQTVAGWQLVIVNNGVSPSSIEGALAPYRDALGARLSVLHLADRRGMEAASNAGIRAGTAPWILVHDDDDSLRPTFLERCLDTLAMNGLEAVVTRALVVHERHLNGRLQIEREEPFRPEVTTINAAQLERENLFPPISLLFSRRGWEATGPFREDLEVLGDWEFNRRFATHFRIGFLDEPLARWHRRPPDDVLPNTDDAAHARVRARLRAEHRPALRGGPSGRLPDVLVIGAQRAGTTWLHRNLARHPGIWLPPAKELHFFDSLYGPDEARWAEDRRHFFLHCRDAVLRAGADLTALEAARSVLQWAGRFAAPLHPTPEWYASLFAMAPAGTITGDITPGYAVLPEEGVSYVARTLPGAKVLMLLRDPLERSLSGALHEVTRGLPDGTAPSAEALHRALDAPGCVARSAYRTTIERWERHFGPGRLHLLFFDEVRTDPQAVLRQVCGLIGAPFSPEHFPDAKQRENASSHDAAALAGPEVLRRLAARHADDLGWLAERIGGSAERWASRARALLSET